MTEQFEIRDWTNKLCFDGRRFNSFEDGWAFIYENDPDPEDGTSDWYGDYYVVPVGERSNA
jgi:hypothetical protein